MQPSMTTSHGANDPMARRSSFKTASLIIIWSAACKVQRIRKIIGKRKDWKPRENGDERARCRLATVTGRQR